MSAQATDHAAHADHAHDEHHHELGWWRKYVFSTDHKVIGVQYGITGLLFLFFGLLLMLVMRWSIAHGEQPLPGFIGWITHMFFGNGVITWTDYTFPSGPRMGEVLSGWSLTKEGYNVFGAMHGTIMVFFGIVPAAFAGFANFVMPLQIGAPDMTFPRINMASYWSLFISCVILLLSFVVPGGAAKSGWTSYPPLAGIRDAGFWHVLNGQTLWILAMVFNITASLLGSLNFIATMVQLRAPGLTWMRLPFFCWAIFITAYLLLLAFPVLEAAAVMQLMDRVFGTSFFMPTGPHREWAARGVRGRWQSALVAASFLVPRASGGLCADPAGDRNRHGDHREQHAQADLGLQDDGRRDLHARLPLLHRLGAPHVHDRDGCQGLRLFPDDDDHHSVPSGHFAHGAAALAVGRLDPVHDADAFRHGLPADVRDWRTHRHSARV
jgi:hypothetical protein